MRLITKLLIIACVPIGLILSVLALVDLTAGILALCVFLFAVLLELDLLIGYMVDLIETITQSNRFR